MKEWIERDREKISLSRRLDGFKRRQVQIPKFKRYLVNEGLSHTYFSTQITQILKMNADYYTDNLRYLRAYETASCNP
jgi:hypothetical protein